MKAGGGLHSGSGKTRTARIVADKPIRKSFCRTGCKCLITILPPGKNALKKAGLVNLKGKIKK
ncbi:hypothetical protein NX90_01135 [Neisseria meningitidis]|nr:hypothetical protein NX90_01135 [Neisseria meningitidis]